MELEAQQYNRVGWIVKYRVNSKVKKEPDPI